MPSVLILGAVLAGGQSRRFGSDKAAALLGGRPLIDHAAAALSVWCDAVVITGREEGPAPCLPDWPEPGMGPLAGLAAALRYAQTEGYSAVLSCGLDSPGLPQDLPALLGYSPVCLADQPVIGLWPATAFAAAEAILLGQGRHSMKALAEALGARQVSLPVPPANINFREDLPDD
jgi:molybdopterin-guanine dinucleotide biosynthesis protein A